MANTTVYPFGVSGVLPESIEQRFAQIEQELEELEERPAVQLSLELSFERLGKIWDNTQAGDTTVYSPCIIKPVHANPLGKYYMYYSYDHGGDSGTNVGIKLAYSDDLLNWTKYGTVLKAKTQFNLGSDKETETPWVVWDAKNSRYLMYWHSSYNNGDGPSYAQITYISYSTDGIDWTYIKPAITTPLSHIVGNGHDGYFKAFVENGVFYGYSLLGGADDWFEGEYVSTDGLNFVVSQASNPVIHSEGYRFCALGRYFCIKNIGQDSSGDTPKIANLGIQECLADYRTPVGDCVVFVQMNPSLGESTDIRAISGLIDDGTIYIVYNCKTTSPAATSFFLGKLTIKED